MPTKNSRRKESLTPTKVLTEQTSENATTEPQIKRLFGTIYLWRPKQKIFFRSLYLWEREEASNEYYFGTNESICNVIIKNTSTVAPIHAKIRLHEGKVELLGLAEGRILKVCLPSANPGLPRSISKGSQRGNQVWYVDDVECGAVQELEDWSVFAVERKVFMIRMPDDRVRMKEKDEIAYCFGEESPFNKVFGLVHQLKKCNYKFIEGNEEEEEEENGGDGDNNDGGEGNEGNEGNEDKEDDKEDIKDGKCNETDSKNTKRSDTEHKEDVPVEESLSEDVSLENKKGDTNVSAADDNNSTNDNYVPPKKSARGHNGKTLFERAGSEESAESDVQSTSESEWTGSSENEAPKKSTRGRKRKYPLERNDSGSQTSSTSENDGIEAPKKSTRGRKRKYTLERIHSYIQSPTLTNLNENNTNEALKRPARGGIEKTLVERVDSEESTESDVPSTSESEWTGSSENETPKKSTRGRKRKYPLERNDSGSQTSSTSESDGIEAPKKSTRGRKRKYTSEQLESTIQSASASESEESDESKWSTTRLRKRGSLEGNNTGKQISNAGGNGTSGGTKGSPKRPPKKQPAKSANAGGAPQMKVGEEVRAPAGMKLRYSRKGNHFDVNCVWEICNRFHLHRGAMVGLTMGEVESLGTWRFEGVYDTKGKTLRGDLKPVVLK